MKSDSGESKSLWMNTAVPDQPVLAEDAEADVCIVGAGIAGMTTAYLLGKEGKQVIVLDDGSIGGGETCRTTAHLSNALDDRYQELERLFGHEGARLAAESHTAAIDRIERIAADEGISCEFARLDGYLFQPPGSDAVLLDDELSAAHRAGLKAVERLDRAPDAPFDTGPCLRFPRQGQFHVMKYLAGLAAAIHRAGGRIHYGAHVTDVFGGPHARVKTTGGQVVQARQAVVVATNSPINDRIAMHTKLEQYRTYVIALRVPSGAVARALYWDTETPYHYVRLAPDGDNEVLIVGGEDHKTGQAEDEEACWERLERWARERFSLAGEVAYRWSGQVIEPLDALAFTGRNPGDDSNVFIHTGDSGQGMTHGTIAGMLLTDLILRRENPWAEIYDPSRITLKSAPEFARYAADFVARYADWLTPGSVKAVSEIEPGGGAVIRHGLSKAAVYRDDAGELHARSAVCRHMGCIVDWNGAERTWDCPCHGARYDALGKVLNGPANSDLAPIDPKNI